LRNEEFHNLYSSPNIIITFRSRKVRWVWHVTRMGEKRNACRVSVRRPEEKRHVGISRCRWEDGSNMDLREIGWCGIDWIQVVQDRDHWRTVVNMVMNPRVQ
jgi:hypothetical protein